MTYTYEFPKADHTVDAVVFGLDLDEGVLKVLLIERGREDEPFHESWALPGGFIDMDEDLEDALRRELREETGLDVSYVEQLYTFGKPGRDPRGRVISTAYLALVRPTEVQGADDARAAEWKPVKDLPPLAFDHEDILKVGLQRLRSKVRWQPVGFGLLPSEFTLTQLQRVYEIILGRSLDKRNFRRKLGRFGVLDKTAHKVAEKGRPAHLYSFSRSRYRGLHENGIDFEV